MVAQSMEDYKQTLQLRSNDQTTTNRRTLRGLGLIMDKERNMSPLQPFTHQS